jgi:hypothetical protein
LSVSLGSVGIRATVPAPKVQKPAVVAKPAAVAAAKPVVVTPAARPATVVKLSGAPPAATGSYTLAEITRNASAPAVAAPVAASSDANGFIAGDGPVAVDILNSDSGYDNKIYWSSDNWKTKNLLGVDNQTSTTTIGTFAAGTRIDFGIDNGQGGFYKTGAAAGNADNFQHAQVTSLADGVHIGFEDLAGGGDRDFNDAIVRVRTLAAPSAPAAPPPVAEKPAAASNNRSGLADGTNPGQGDGRTNSPNQGTNNPNQATAVPVAAPVALKKVVAAPKPAPVPVKRVVVAPAPTKPVVAVAKPIER